MGNVPYRTIVLMHILSLEALPALILAIMWHNDHNGATIRDLESENAPVDFLS